MTFLYKNTSLNLICCRFVLGGKKNVKDVIINEDDNLIIFFFVSVYEMKNENYDDNYDNDGFYDKNYDYQGYSKNFD